MSPVKNTPMPDILGSALKAAREARRYERSELAGLCCLSAKMISELEEGGMSSFYSYPLKINAAKRVGNLLNLSESDYLNYPRAPIVSAEGDEEGALEGEIKNEASETSPTVKASPPVRDGLSAASVDPAITERLKWQELLTEKVGGGFSGVKYSRWISVSGEVDRIPFNWHCDCRNRLWPELKIRYRISGCLTA